MSDYIEREALKNAIYADGNLTAYLEYIINRIPAADVREVVRGEWKTALLDHEGFGIRPKVLYCSECHQAIAYKTNYCPNCGAEMKGEAE